MFDILDELLGILMAAKSDPIANAASITPADGTELTTACRAIYVGGAGDLTCTMANGSTVTFSSVPAGTTIAITPVTVQSTGTTATNILALW